MYGAVVEISACNEPSMDLNKAGGDRTMSEWLEVTFRFCWSRERSN
jgi:hypothetical protein